MIMLSRFRTTVKNLDWVLLSAVTLLSSFGLVEIYSIALSRGGDFTNFKKQAAFIAIGLFVVLLASMVDYYQLRGFWPFLFIAGLGVKAALVPLHGWVPDAHPAAPAHGGSRCC